MSVLGISEFEETPWDEFFQVHDHMVPHDGFERFNDHFPWHDSLRNTLRDINCNSSNSENGYPSLHDKCGAMSDTDALSHERSSMFPFPSESDLSNETSGVAFHDTSSSCHVFKINDTDSKGGEFPGDDTYIGERNTPVDNQSGITRQGNSFNSFENTDSTDFLSGVCPDIQSFEDVDWMLGSPDSTFGVGVNKEDELRWLSSGNDGGGLEFEFSCSKSSTEANKSADKDSSKRSLIDDSAIASAPIKFKDSSCTSEKSDFDIPFVNEPALADSKDSFFPRDEMTELSDTLHPLHPRNLTNSHSKTTCGEVVHEVKKKQFKPLKQPKGIRKERNSGKGSCRYLSNLPIEAVQLLSAATSYKDFPSAYLHKQQKQTSGLRNHISNAPLDKSHLTDQTAVNQPPSAVKCSGTDLTSLSKWEFSKQLSQLRSMECFHDLPSAVTSLAGFEKIETQRNNQGMLVYLCGDKFEDTIDADGVGLVNPAELGISIVQESSMLSLEDISPEAASFGQLQLVMEWLDVRTKLCIRDGLYLLARGAKQRHDHANLCGNSGDGKPSSGLLVADGKIRSTNFTNMETGTNPIDRSIAHLLYHRPSDSCAIPAHDSVTGRLKGMLPVGH